MTGVYLYTFKVEIASILFGAHDPHILNVLVLRRSDRLFLWHVSKRIRVELISGEEARTGSALAIETKHLAQCVSILTL